MEKETLKKPAVAEAKTENATTKPAQKAAPTNFVRPQPVNSGNVNNVNSGKPAFAPQGPRFVNRSANQNTQSAEKFEKRVEKPELKLPELDEFLKAGAHFGHKSSRWNPKMAPFIYDVRGGVHILDLVKSLKLLKVALKKMQDSSDRGSILIVGTKGQAASLVNEMALENGAFYVNKRWPGGLFTNFEVIKKSLDKLMKMEEHISKGGQGLVKKEQILMEREIGRLNELYSGIKFMDRLPELLLVIDSKVEKNAIAEARSAGIPIVALVDTNCDPSVIDYVIPANDDSIRSLKLFMSLFAQAIRGGRRSDALKGLRRDYTARLEKTAADFKADVEKKRAMAEADMERIKALRKGEYVSTETETTVKKEKVVRFVEKS
jgi:small subunit ribosomal protein S2